MVTTRPRSEVKRESDQTANLIRGTGRWSINFCPLQLLHSNSEKNNFLPPTQKKGSDRSQRVRERRERERERGSGEEEGGNHS